MHIAPKNNFMKKNNLSLATTPYAVKYVKENTEILLSFTSSISTSFFFELTINMKLMTIPAQPMAAIAKAAKNSAIAIHVATLPNFGGIVRVSTGIHCIRPPIKTTTKINKAIIRSAMKFFFIENGRFSGKLFMIMIYYLTGFQVNRPSTQPIT